MKFMPSNVLAAVRRCFLAALLPLFLFSRASAEEAPPPSRWLLIFDTSFAMKKRLPGVETEIKDLLTTAFGGQLHEGDSIGLWTFDKNLHTGKFPLLDWEPEVSATIASNVVAFVHKQSYTGVTTWSVLQPQLNQVIRHSAHLTIVIFCDGDGQVDWTPYNGGINQTFSDAQAERKKAHQPFVLLVRTQHGQFTGCTVNFPPGALNVPPFPLPPPVKIIPTNPPPVMVPPPVVVVPSLFIVGTNVATNVNDLPKITAPVLTNAAIVPPVAPTNVLAAGTPLAVPGNLPPPPAALPAPVLKTAEVKTIPAATNYSPIASSPPTNAAPATVADASDHGGKTLAYVGVGLFAAAGALIIFLWLRAVRRPHGSLISDALQNDPRLPPRK
jgi:hypothetical protein